MTQGLGIGGHHGPVMENDEWLTPPHILAALGEFDLDPCAPVVRPWPMAKEHFTVHDNGLRKPWQGRVWLNPPYGAEVGQWMGRLADHGRGCALIFARTETRDWFTHIWSRATGILFLQDRLYFHYVDGRRAGANSGAPSALIAYGDDDADQLREAVTSGSLKGAFIRSWFQGQSRDQGSEQVSLFARE